MGQFLKVLSKGKFSQSALEEKWKKDSQIFNNLIDSILYFGQCLDHKYTIKSGWGATNNLYMVGHHWPRKGTLFLYFVLN